MKELEKRYGSIESEGKTFILVEQAYAVDSETYKAYAICPDDLEDADGYRKAYRVSWDVLESYDPQEMDEDAACDWSTPADIEESNMTYSVSDKAFA